MNKSLLYLLFIIVFSSCSTKKKTVTATLPKTNARTIIDKVHAANKIPDWLWLKGEIRLYKQEQSVNLNLNIKVRKDSVIWASVSAPFGIELFRTMLTKDSVYYLNRTNKTYFIKPISHIQEILKTTISFNTIQQMITATPRIIKQKYKVSNGANLRSIIIQTENIRYKVAFEWYLY